ncbi:MAG: AraC family transcriptional regulator [Bacteroidota bacterium]|nr:AraC family transcriptional regulator [Bacteroidota bacterium]
MTKEQYPKVYLYRRIVQAKLFIDNNYFEKIDLNNIADNAFFSKFHFLRLFKKIYNKTPHQYLITVRIKNAKLLLKTDTSIIDVCYSIGFESVSSFTELFKRYVGMTPYSYQLQQRKRKAEIIRTPIKFIPGCFASSNG